MEQKKPDSIDDFLESLGVGVEKPTQAQPPPGPVLVRVVYERSKGTNPYTLHAFVYNSIDFPPDLTKASSEGRMMEAQPTFKVENLRRFSEILEKLLEEVEVAFHRSIPTLPTANDTLISYELMPRLADPTGSDLYTLTRGLVGVLYDATGGDLTKPQ